MRTVFLGTSDFAVAVLERLAASSHRPRSWSRGRTGPAAGAGGSPAARGRGGAGARDRADPAGRASTPTRRASGSPPPSPRRCCICAFGALIKEPLLSELRDAERAPVAAAALARRRADRAGDRGRRRGDRRQRSCGPTAELDAGPVCLQRERADPAGRRLRLARRRGWPSWAASCSCEVLDERPEPARAARRGRDLRGEDRRRRPPARSRPAGARSWRGRVRALNPHIGAWLELPDAERLGVRSSAGGRPTARHPASSPPTTASCSTAPPRARWSCSRCTPGQAPDGRRRDYLRGHSGPTRPGDRPNGSGG